MNHMNENSASAFFPFEILRLCFTDIKEIRDVTTLFILINVDSPWGKLKKLLLLQALIRSAVFVLQILFTKHHKEITGQISCINTDSNLPS